MTENSKPELARCDREIERIKEEAYAGNPDIHGMLLGLHDWRTEKKLIAVSTRTSHLITQQPSLNSTSKDNPSD